MLEEAQVCPFLIPKKEGMQVHHVLPVSGRKLGVVEKTFALYIFLQLKFILHEYIS